ncbi:MAG: UDP-glucose/GDP-mannose dehydrogenase family protein [Chlorobiota bacterium]
MRVGIIGTGYVGLVTGLCFAETGNEVICVDVDAAKIERLRSGEIPFYEPGLQALLSRNLQKQRVSFTTELSEAAANCDVLMLCLPTPSQEDGSADVQRVFAVARELIEYYRRVPPEGRRLLVTKSTVPPGTTRQLAELFHRELPTVQITVASNPEFLSQGSAVENFMKPERVIIGTGDPWAATVLRTLYEPFVRTGNPIYVMDETSAEVTKYASNAFLAMRVSFMNELSAYCEAVGADIEQVRLGMGADSRIGKRYLFAGLGYGGSCLPKDIRALMHSARSVESPLELIPAVARVNERQLRRFVEKIRHRFGSIDGRVLALWGVAFKPNTDDIREAPALYVIDALLQDGGRIRVYDPQALDNLRRLYGERLTYTSSAYECAEGADALIIATEWAEFRNPDFHHLRRCLRQAIIFDGRNLFSPAEMLRLGFEYYSIGRPSVYPLGSPQDVR